MKYHTLFFSKIRKENLSSAAVVTVALMVYISLPSLFAIIFPVNIDKHVDIGAVFKFMYTVIVVHICCSAYTLKHV